MTNDNIKLISLTKYTSTEVPSQKNLLTATSLRTTLHMILFIFYLKKDALVYICTAYSRNT